MTEKTIYALDRKKSLYLKSTKTKGRGVFCASNIRKHEELEVTPALVLHEAEHQCVEKTILRDYVFSLGKVSKKLCTRMGIKKVEDACCVIMGMMSFCNHDEHPNAEILWEERNGTLYHTLRATRAIPKGTEICTTYGSTWFDGRDHRNNI